MSQNRKRKIVKAKLATDPTLARKEIELLALVDEVFDSLKEETLENPTEELEQDIVEIPTVDDEKIPLEDNSNSSTMDIFETIFEPSTSKIIEKHDLKGVNQPKKLSGITRRQLIASVSLFVSFALLYNVLIRPYDDKTFAGPALSTTTVECTEKSTIETTAETTTEITETTTAKPMKAITKPYTEKVKQVYVAPPKSKVLLDVPHVSQNPNYPTGCEAGSATMLLRFYGYNVTVDTLINEIPRENLTTGTLPDGTVVPVGPSIYQKFVGNPRCTYTSATPGYGAFAPVITSAINRIIAKQGGRHIAKNITGSSVETLFSYIDSGHPVIIWSTSGMKVPTEINAWYIKTASGYEYFKYPRGTHVTVLKGYDSKRIYIEDPWTDNQYTKKYYIDKFAVAYNLLYKQAIVIVDRAPNETLIPTTTTTAPSTTAKPTTIETTTTTTTTEPSTEEDSTEEDGTTETSTTTTTNVIEESGTASNGDSDDGSDET